MADSTDSVLGFVTYGLLTQNSLLSNEHGAVTPFMLAPCYERHRRLKKLGGGAKVAIFRNTAANF